MIKRIREYGERKYLPVCDRCGATLASEWDFEYAVDAMHEKSWSFRKDAFSGEWEHFCPSCTRALRPSAASDFAGIV